MKLRSIHSAAFSFFLIGSLLGAAPETKAGIPHCRTLLDNTVSLGVQNAVKSGSLPEAVVLTFAARNVSAFRHPDLWALTRQWVEKNLGGRLQGLGPDELGLFSVTLEDGGLVPQGRLLQLQRALRTPLRIPVSQGQIVLAADRTAVQTPEEWATERHFRYVDGVQEQPQSSIDPNTGAEADQAADTASVSRSERNRTSRTWDVPADRDPVEGRQRWDADSSDTVHAPRGTTRGNTAP